MSWAGIARKSPSLSKSSYVPHKYAFFVLHFGEWSATGVVDQLLLSCQRDSYEFSIILAMNQT